MYKILFTISLMTIAVACAAQIEKTSPLKWERISQIKEGLRLIASLQYAVQDGDTTYSIVFTNNKYTHIIDIKSIDFAEDGGVLTSLYTLLIESLEAPKGNRNTFKLGGKDVSVTTDKMLGLKFITFEILDNEANFRLTKKQLNKLFNKKDS